MTATRFANRNLARWLLIAIGVTGLDAQTCLVLSPTTVSTNGTALLDLSLYSARGKEPAVVQWTFQYQSSSIQTLTVDDGPVLTAAGKTAMCSGGASSYSCLAVGTNTNAIGNGIIARLIAVLVPGATTADILIKSPQAASSSGYLIPVLSEIAPSSRAGVYSDCRPQLQRRLPVGK